MLVRQYIRRHTRRNVQQMSKSLGGSVPRPDWWNIASLDEADIIGAWDFAWGGHETSDDALVPFVGINPFTVENGTPTAIPGTGITFDGASNLKMPLPTVEISELSVVIQFSNATQASALDAFFSHYLTSSHFSLQNDFSNGNVRWSVGDADSDTVEVASLQTEGIYGVSGPFLYINGTLAAELLDPGTAEASGLDFRLGALYVSSVDQYLKANVQRIMIVDRILTDAEQWEISYKMKHGITPPWWLTTGLDNDDAAAIYDFAGANSLSAALKAIVGPDLNVTAGGPGHSPGDGIGFGGLASLEMDSGITVAPGETTLMVKLLNPSNPTSWQCFVGFDIVTDCIAIQQKVTDGVCHYNGPGYDGTHNNYVCNLPVASSEWLVNAGGVLYRNGVAAPNVLTPTVRPEASFVFTVGSLGTGQRYNGTISQVFIYRKVLTEAQVAAIMNNATRGPVVHEHEAVTHDGGEVTYHG